MHIGIPKATIKNKYFIAEKWVDELKLNARKYLINSNEGRKGQIAK